MFLKYFCILLQKFQKGFIGQITGLFLASVIGGLLELLGIAMIFPIMLVLTSDETTGGRVVFDFCLKFFPNSSPMQIAFILSLIMIGIFLFKNLFMIGYIRAQNEFVRKWSDFVNEKVVKKLLYAPFADLKTLTYGDKNTLLFSIVRDISLDFVLRCIILIANGVVALFIIALLFYKFTITAFLSTAFILIFAYFENLYFKKNARKLGNEGVKLVNDFALNTNFIIQSEKEILISNKQEHFARYLMDSSKKVSDNFSKRISFGNFPLYVTEIGVILAFLIMIVSIALTGGTSRGAIVSSLAVIALMVLRLVPQLNKILISMYTINLSKQKVFWFLEKYEQISKFGYEEFKNAPKISFNSVIRLEGAGFDFGIEDINLEIKKGEFIGVIGLSGAGKTTLIDIISGVYLPKTGRMFVDNVEITRENLTGWQKNISLLPQEPVFMNASIIENVPFGEKVDLEKVKTSLSLAGLDPSDLDLYKSGLDLSVGQKRRVALARAYYRDFELLILDEATSALDMKSEDTVSENVARLAGEKTVIAIAHRLSTLKKCNRVIYLENGKIKDIAPLRELSARHFEIEQMLKKGTAE